MNEVEIVGELSHVLHSKLLWLVNQPPRNVPPPPEIRPKGLLTIGFP